MSKKLTIVQNPLPEEKRCLWHKDHLDGRSYSEEELFPNRVCPFLYHSIYPYFLGLHFGAKFSWNELGDANTNCPAAKGVDVIVKKRPNDGSFDPRIPSSMQHVIHAEVYDVHGECPYGHKRGDIIVFPTCMKQYYLCPAGINNVFPFLKLDVPSCIDPSNLRCPDFNDVITYALD